MIETAKVSVGQHHGPAYRIQVRHTCQNPDLLRRRIREPDGDITRQLDDHDVGSLLTSTDGIGPHTAARLIAELGDLSRFRMPRRWPPISSSCPTSSNRASAATRGPASARSATPACVPPCGCRCSRTVRRNPWLEAFYNRLISRGKLPKVALVAALRKLLGAVFAVVRDRKPFVPRSLASSGLTSSCCSIESRHPVVPTCPTAGSVVAKVKEARRATAEGGAQRP